jgi:hypothetical protein
MDGPERVFVSFPHLIMSSLSTTWVALVHWRCTLSLMKLLVEAKAPVTAWPSLKDSIERPVGF